MVMMLAIPFPGIDPVALSLGPVMIRWYSLAYIVGVILGWLYCQKLALRRPGAPSGDDFTDFLPWAMLAIVIGGRLGYILFYGLEYYLAHPGEILMLWRGGMSFHGGLLGVSLAMILFARARKIPVLAFSDLISCAAPIGLFLGRIANFINGELFGRVTEHPWGMVFPNGGTQPRHPSQLYEAFLEGVMLFVILAVIAHMQPRRMAPHTPPRHGVTPHKVTRHGVLTGVFLLGYGLARTFVELFREPDQQLGFLFGGLTMGQLLSWPMIIGGGSLLLWAALRSGGHSHENN